MSKAKKITIWILSILIVLSVIANGIMVYKIKNKPKPPSLDVIPYEHYYIPQDIILCTLTKTEVKEMIDDVYKTSYTYNEVGYLGVDLRGDTLQGNADTTNRHISVLSNLQIINYIEVLSHEIVHIKYQTTNETFTEYTSIISLYESDVGVFRSVALNRARFIIGGGCAGTEYDCGYYLIEYFKGREL